MEIPQDDWETAFNSMSSQPWLQGVLLNKKEIGLRIQTLFQDHFLESKS